MNSKNFIQKAKYPGGSEALNKFIMNNLCYPKQAFNYGIEGKVFLAYEVNEKGRVHRITVLNGLGYGCDEEATRIVSLLQYPSVKNRGVKVNTRFKLGISFKKPESPPLKVNYILKK